MTPEMLRGDDKARAVITVAIYNQIEHVGGHSFVLCEKHRGKFCNSAEAACILIDLPQQLDQECIWCKREEQARDS